MKITYKRIKNTFMIIFMFTLCICGVTNAKTVKAANEDDFNIQSENKEDIDWDIIYGALGGQNLKDGDTIVIDDKYMIECEVSIEQVYNDRTRAVLGNTISSQITYSIYKLNEYIKATTIVHKITYSQYDNGTTYIHSASISVGDHIFYFKSTVYEKRITNGTGVSSSYAMIETLDQLEGRYYYYGTSVFVFPTGLPIIDFSQV